MASLENVTFLLWSNSLLHMRDLKTGVLVTSLPFTNQVSGLQCTFGYLTPSYWISFTPRSHYWNSLQQLPPFTKGKKSFQGLPALDSNSWFMILKGINLILEGPCSGSPLIILYFIIIKIRKKQKRIFFLDFQQSFGKQDQRLDFSP